MLAVVCLGSHWIKSLTSCDLQLLGRPTQRLKQLVRALYGEEYHQRHLELGDDVLGMLYPGSSYVCGVLIQG